MDKKPFIMRVTLETVTQAESQEEAQRNAELWSKIIAPEGTLVKVHYIEVWPK